MPPRRLYRSRADKKLAGVCGGLAEYFDIDPAFVRIAAVVLFLMNGIGLVGYLIAWAAIPVRPDGVAAEEGAASGSPPRPAEAGFASGPHGLELIAGGLFIVAGLLFLLLNLGYLDWEIFQFWRWRVVWPLALIGLGLYVVISSLRTQQRTREP